MTPVILESPYAGNVEANVKYARECVKDCLRRGEAPFASHLLYTQEGILDDTDPVERKLGIESGFAWRTLCSRTVVYTDLGVSLGMYQGIDHAREMGHNVVYRQLSPGEMVK